MPQDTRRDFEPWKVEEVYRLQDGCCDKCGKPLGAGFIRDHRDANHANNSITNLRLLCPRCSESEQYPTFVKQMEALKKNTDVLIEKAISGSMAGTAIDKTLDAIKLSLSLNTQLYGYEVEKPPAAIAAQQYIESSRILLDQWEDAMKQGILKGIDMVEKIKKDKK